MCWYFYMICYCPLKSSDTIQRKRGKEKVKSHQVQLLLKMYVYISCIHLDKHSKKYLAMWFLRYKEPIYQRIRVKYPFLASKMFVHFYEKWHPPCDS